MARVDKTQSAVGVVRAPLAADVAEADYDKPVGYGIDAQGRAVRGNGQTKVVGILVADSNQSAAGDPVDLFVLADVVECEGLAAGTRYFAAANGDINTTDTGIYVGFTVEADRLIVRM